jgi:2-polyprenyl-3-methyl-5-hydroxy-6-metoxy-1,4-benzoquinol methylase
VPADYVALGTDPYSAHQLVIKYAAGSRRVLDVGCSAGALAAELSARGAVVDGIDSDPVAAQEATQHCRKVVVGDLETMQFDFDEEYDVIVLADVLEHLRDPIALLRRLRPHLAPGGRVVVSTPNIANWSMRLLHLAGRWEYAERGIMDRTHVHFFTRRSLLRAMAAAGYRVRHVDVTAPVPILRRPPYSRVAHWLAMRLQGLLAYQFVVEAEST